MRGFSLIILAACLSASTLASFDLILIADNTNDVIHRIDGDTGTYLGSFGGNVLADPRAITIDQTNNIAYVGDAVVGIVAMNYNTGQVLWSNNFTTAFSDLAFTPGLLYRTTGVLSPNACQRFVPSPTNNSLISFSAPVQSTFRGVGVDATGDILTVDATNNRVVRYSVNGFGAAEAIGAAGSFTGQGGIDVEGTSLISLQANGAMVLTSTQGTLTGNTGLTPSGPAWTSARDVAFGHQNFAWGVGVAGSTRLQRYARSFGGSEYNPAGNGMSFAQIGNPTGMAVVVAPEPGTLAALAAGALFLRRKRKASVKN